MDIFETFATDDKKEIEGVEVKLDDKGASVTVARAGNDNFIRRLLEETEKHREALDAGTSEAKELDKQIGLQLMAETILVGFKGLTLKGKPLKYTNANALELLKIKDFRRRVQTESNKVEYYRVKAEAADTKD